MKLMTSCAALAATLALGAPALAQQTQAAPSMNHNMGAMGSQPATPAVPATPATPPAAGDMWARPAQPPASAVPATPSMGPAPSMAQPSASSATAAGADVSVTTGMSVKDNTGAAIGSISEVKADATGNKVATIKMGADSFAVDTTSLAVKDGAAVINASQAEIKDMMKKK